MDCQPVLGCQARDHHDGKVTDVLGYRWRVTWAGTDAGVWTVVAGSPVVPLLLSCNLLGLRAAGRAGESHSLPLRCVWAMVGVGNGRCSSNARDSLRVTQARDLSKVTAN